MNKSTVHSHDRSDQNRIEQIRTVLELEGRFDLESWVQSTDYGELYRGKQRTDSRVIHIKYLPLNEIQRIQDRIDELTAIQKLDHPCIEKILWFGSDDSCLVIVCEALDVVSYASWIEKNRQDYDAILVMLEKIARLVQYLSDHGVIHGYIVPSNISFSNDPILLGAGVYPKRLIDPTKDLDRRDFRFVAPEFLRGDQQKIGVWTDVYGLGQILYGSLIGHLPFEKAPPEEVVEMVAHDRPLPPRLENRDIPRELDAIAMKSLSKRRLRRYMNPREFADDICRYRNDEVIVASLLRRESLIKAFFVICLGIFMFSAIATGIYIAIPPSLDDYSFEADMGDDAFEYEFD